MNSYRWDSFNSIDQPTCVHAVLQTQLLQLGLFCFLQSYRRALCGCFVFKWHLPVIYIVVATQALARQTGLSSKVVAFFCSNFSPLPSLSRGQRTWPGSKQGYRPAQEPGELARCTLVTFGQTGAAGKIREQSPSPGKNHQWTSPGPNNGWATCGNIKGRHPGHE